MLCLISTKIPMLFNSLEFAFFLPTVFFLYWILFRKIQLQNLLILIASYFFYGWWDYKFLSLIIFSTVVDYSIGRFLQNKKDKITRKGLLWSSILINLGILGVFKYFNFFVDSFYNILPGLKTEGGFNTLDILLPVGISFYTFQTMSYTIDVYRRKIEASKDFLSFATFVSFFPQLVAGPIERAGQLLPQFCRKRKFEYEKAVDGLRQILWGLFMKIVIADNCAIYVNSIFNNADSQSGSTLFIGAVLFAFQIYGDFAGYSNIAIGTARLFGFNLMKNFAFPYFSRDIAEFWRRWHISLSTWFRDYLYFPLGGSRGSIKTTIRNVFIVFIVSGFWHGANWTFIVWGFLHALYFIPLLFLGVNRKNIGNIDSGNYLPTLKEAINIFSTFLLTTIAWIFFRAENLKAALSYIYGIFDTSFFSVPIFPPGYLLYLLFAFIIIEWLGKKSEYALEHVPLKLPRAARVCFYYTIIFLIFYLGTEEQKFIYFQF